MSVILQKNKIHQRNKFRSILRKVGEKVQTETVTIQWHEIETTRENAFIFTSYSNEEYTLKTRDMLGSFVTLAVVEWIIQVLEPDILRQSLMGNRQSQVRNKWEEIYPYVQFVFHSSDTRKSKLYHDIFAYLQENRELFLDGFSRFRLKDYWKALQAAVDTGIHEYLQDKEYQEFVELLRYFVSVQETKYPIVHVVPHESKGFLLYDESDKLIDVGQMESVLGLANQECREEDFLVSVLITLAPEKINFHILDINPTLLETLKTIFDKRIFFCSSCMYCLTNSGSLDLPKPTHYNT